MPPVNIRRSGEIPLLRHSVTLVGPASSLRWPDVCVSCGRTSAQRVPVTRVFDRDWRRGIVSRSGGDFRFVTVQTIAVPVCSACVRRHHDELRPVGVFRTLLSLVANVWVIPVVVAVLGALRYPFPHMLGSAGTLVAETRNAAAAAIFALAAAGAAVVAWHQTRPRRVAPPTSVTAAFDFSDNLADFFRAERRVYGMDNDAFAQAFRQANMDRVWSASR